MLERNACASGYRRRQSSGARCHLPECLHAESEQQHNISFTVSYKGTPHTYLYECLWQYVRLAIHIWRGWDFISYLFRCLLLCCLFWNASGNSLSRLCGKGILASKSFRLVFHYSQIMFFKIQFKQLQFCRIKSFCSAFVWHCGI